MEVQRLSKSPSRHIRSTAAVMVAVTFAVSALLAAVRFRMLPMQAEGMAEGIVFAAKRTAPTAVLTGKSCQNCHAEVCESHATAPHGRTLTRLNNAIARQVLAGRSWKRPDTGVQYDYRAVDERLMMSSSATARSWEITWLVGSGRHAQTPLLTWLDAEGKTASIEHSVSLYPDGELGTTLEMEAVSESLGLPALGNYRSCSETANCFGCHSTVVPVVAGRVLEDEIVPGVGCIRCHADAEEHSVAMERGNAFTGERLSLLSPRESVDRCGECHRRADELGGPLHPDNPLLVRFASVGLSQSQCFQKQPHGMDRAEGGETGRLDCLSCHSPHAETDARWQTHAAVCLRCHAATSSAADFACPEAGPGENCLSCHMKKVQSGERLWFTDHWIR